MNTATPQEVVQVPRVGAREAIARFEHWLAGRAPGAPRPVMVFDADGTLWACDVGEILFEAALAAGLIRTEALAELQRLAHQFSIGPTGTPTELAARLYEAYRQRIIPERTGAEMLIWCYAGWSDAEWLEFAHATMAQRNIDGLHIAATIELLAWARRQGLRVLIISASPFAAVAAAARTLHVEAGDIVAARPASVQGRFVAQLGSELPWGMGKVHCGRSASGETPWLAACGDSGFDVAMMQQASFAIAVRPREELRARFAELALQPSPELLELETDALETTRDAADVTVVVPVHDGAATIEETLRSLQQQTCARWRAIVVDDGSRDETASVVQRLAASDPRIEYRYQTARGVSAARNSGLGAARSEWVMFLDADDWIAADFLEHMLAAVRAQPHADAAFCGSRRVLPDGSLLAELPGEEMTYPRALLDDPVRTLAESCPLAIHSVIARRKACIDAGEFDTALTTSEDWDFWLRLSRTGARWVGVPLPLAFYRQRAAPAGERLERIVRDAHKVITAARRPDQRVRRPHASFIAGVSDSDLAQRLAGVTLYFIGVAAGEACEVRHLFATLAAWPDLGHESQMREAVRDVEAGLAVGARLPHSKLAAAWQRFWPRISEIRELIGARSARSDAGNDFLCGIETLLLESSDLDTPCTLETSAGVRVDLDALPAVIESALHVDRLYLRVECAGRTVDAMWFDRTLDVQRGELALLLLRRWALDGLLGQAEGFRSTAPLLATGLEILWQRSTGGLRTLDLRTAWHLATRLPQLLRAAREMPQAVAEREQPRATRHARYWHDLEVKRSPPATLGASVASQPADTHDAPLANRAVGGARQIPVLMYHSIAAEGPASLAQWRLHPRLFEEQLAYLQRKGYRSVSSRDLPAFLRTGQAPVERPVLLTFDDGYRDFLHTAWPLLQRYGFTADVFLVTDRVGGSADWDRSHGEPAPLMSWVDIARLQREGVTFGSHFATHRRCSLLSTHELVEESARSRAAIEARLDRPVNSMAIPFGTWDERLVCALRWAGYEIGFTTADGIVSAGMRALTLPRVEVFGGQSAAAFARRLESAVA